MGKLLARLVSRGLTEPLHSAMSYLIPKLLVCGSLNGRCRLAATSRQLSSLPAVVELGGVLIPKANSG